MTNNQEVRLAWFKACNYDGIHPRSSFVVFSPENPYAKEYDEAMRRSRLPSKRYECWQSDTCYVCSGGTGEPRYHASTKGYQPTSPCDTTVTVIEAHSRAEALRKYKSRR